jgi:CDP-diacylglycerol---serine O-phosphatidyltransferase
MKGKKRFDKASARRGIYVLPNIFTSLNMFCGFYAVIAAIDGKYVAAAVAIIIGNVFDILDGKIARATRTTSKFGVEYDSLADLITFGVAPGVLIFLWALRPLGRIGWLAAFLFVACGALRLARYNSQVGNSSGDYFTGLPIPAGAAMNATTVLIFSKFGLSGTAYPVFILVMLYGLSFLMVSTVHYPSFKRPELFRKMNFNVLVAVVLILIFVAYQPSIALFFTGVVYLISGPLNTVLHHRRLKQIQKAEADQHEKPRTTPL